MEQNNIKMEIRDITPDEAYEMLKINTRNRTMNKGLVVEYARQMKEGLWQLNGEPIIISDGNVLLDGQHRLAAIKKSNITQRMIIIKGVDSDAFKTIDTGRTRTAGDILAINQVQDATTIAAGVTRYFILHNDKVCHELKHLKTSKQEILAFYTKHSTLCHEIKTKAASYCKKINLFPKSHVFGLFLYLVIDKNHNVEQVDDFFRQLFFDTNITNMTIPLLREKIIKDKMGQVKLVASVRNGLIAKTWNCFVSGKELKVLSYNLKTEQDIDFL